MGKKSLKFPMVVPVILFVRVVGPVGYVRELLCYGNRMITFGGAVG